MAALGADLTQPQRKAVAVAGFQLLMVRQPTAQEARLEQERVAQEPLELKTQFLFPVRFLALLLAAAALQAQADLRAA